MKEKNELRKQMKSLLAVHLTDLNPQIKFAKCESLANLLKAILRAKKVVATFNALESELNINAFLETAQYSLVYPRVEGDNIHFYKPLHEGDFVVGEFGILEPHPERSTPVEASDIDYILVPGLAFDRKLMRLGRGKGYYDRYLNKFKGIKIGIGIKAQLLNEPLPIDEHDQPMDFVVNEEFVLHRLQDNRVA